MKTSRRSLFGWLAGAVVAAPAVAEAAVPAPAPGPFLGQIRAVHSHYETKIVPAYQSWPSTSGQIVAHSCKASPPS